MAGEPGPPPLPAPRPSTGFAERLGRASGG